MKLTELACQHHAWVGRNGWHNSTVLEMLGLIASELGEVADESFEAPLPANFGQELADVMLRVMNLAVTTSVDLDATVAAARISWRSCTLHGFLAEMLVELAGCMNAARQASLGEEFHWKLGRFACRVLELARAEQVDLEVEIRRKMAINAERGTRGRLK